MLPDLVTEGADIPPIEPVYFWRLPLTEVVVAALVVVVVALEVVVAALEVLDTALEVDEAVDVVAAREVDEEAADLEDVAGLDDTDDRADEEDGAG